jgi:diacylglycerol kinase family enzyme
MKGFALIVNQDSGKVPNNLAKLRTLARKNKLKLNLCEGHDLDYEIRKALEDSSLKRLIIGGGDGSVNKAASLILRLKRNVELAVLPLGTANYYAKSLGFRKLEEAFEVAMKGTTEKRHVCIANGREFLIGVNVGNTSRMFAEVTDDEKHRFGRLAYARGILRTLKKATPPDITIKTKGKTKSYASTELVVLNQNIKEPIKLTPEVEGSDPYFEIITYGLGKSKLSPLYAVVRYALSFGRNQKYLTRIKATKAIISSSKKLPVGIDGDVLEKLPLIIELVKKPVTFVKAK